MATDKAKKLATKISPNDKIMVLLKNALEYNAGIVSVATIFVGNCDDPKNQKRFIREYKHATDKYITQQQVLIDELEKELLAP